MKRLGGKRCLIVGGTSGIGLAAARRFLDEGARLAVIGREPSTASGVGVVLDGDVTAAGAVERLFTEAISQLGGLDVLFHVAGASGRRAGDGPLHECTDEGWDF